MHMRTEVAESKRSEGRESVLLELVNQEADMQPTYL